MTDALNELVALLSLERLEENLFRGQSQDLGWGLVFGGQVLGQALYAATMTVPAERQVHSLHGYFLRVGDVRHPIIYDVDRIRDGRSFTTRRVVAIQHGRPIFNLSASFQGVEEGVDHHDEMPEVTPAGELRSEQHLAQLIADQIPEAMRPWALGDRAIEMRPVTPFNPLSPDVRPPRKMVWYRSSGALPDDPHLHRALLAYTSDFKLLTTAMLPHGLSWVQPGMQVASLDHAMWFHRPFRMDQWLLHVMESPSAGGARGFVRGRFFNEEGALVASTAQEGLIRDRRSERD